MSINDLPEYIREAHNKLLADTPETVPGEIYKRRYMILLEMLSLIWKRVDESPGSRDERIRHENWIATRR